ncbi:MAG: hypothetical protein SFW65_07375 [Alphaproteobacteria bacterium]|nr:hypothetical protein [Alphaproteobacteria bacterium]
MAFGYRFKKSSEFTESAKRYNPKLFASLQAQSSPLELMETPKFKIEEFSTNFEYILGDVEGKHAPMRKDSEVDYSETMSETSAA